jgi:hypothetical protein
MHQDLASEKSRTCITIWRIKIWQGRGIKFKIGIEVSLATHQDWATYFNTAMETPTSRFERRLAKFQESADEKDLLLKRALGIALSMSVELDNREILYMTEFVSRHPKEFSKHWFRCRVRSAWVAVR